MPSIGASSHGESHLRLLRVIRRGDRHDPRELTVSFRFEGDFGKAFRDGAAGKVLPGEAVRNLVHAVARAHAAGEIESFGLALCDRILRDHRQISRVRVELAERQWTRLESGGKPHGQAFMAGPPERKTTAVTSNGHQIAVVSGLDHLTLMRTWGFAPDVRDRDEENGALDGLQRLFVGTLAARWTYTSGDVTFRPYRQGIRNALIDTFAWHGSKSVQHTLYAMGDVVLATYHEISDITLALHERPYRPADLFHAGLENPDDLFVAAEEPIGLVEVRVERD